MLRGKSTSDKFAETPSYATFFGRKEIRNERMTTATQEDVFISFEQSQYMLQSWHDKANLDDRHRWNENTYRAIPRYRKL